MGEERNARTHVLPLLAIGLITSICGIALGLLIDWFPVAASQEAKDIDTLWDVLLIFSVPVFVLVETIVLYSVWRWRMRPGEELMDGPPIHGNTRLEVIWTAIPALLLVLLCGYAYVVLRDIEKAEASALRVRVVGEQFTWTFFYRGADGKEVASPQLYVPAGRQVKFDVQSKDVIHDFWVPAWRQKIDAVPGITTSFRVTPDRLGTYPVVCAELCGIGHATMRQEVRVVPEDEWEAWVQDRREGGAAPEEGESPIAAGREIFTSAGCNACHTLDDADATAAVGPDLNDLTSVAEDRDSRASAEDYVKEAIVDPPAFVVKGYSGDTMPGDYEDRLMPEEIDTLVKYLLGLGQTEKGK